MAVERKQSPIAWECNETFFRISFFFIFFPSRLLHALCRVLAEEILLKTLGSKDDADEFTNDFRFYVNQHALSRIYMTNESRFAWRLNFREE
jgi:hypothetical protein